MSVGVSRMRAGERRALSAGEIAIARTVFANEIDLARMRIAQAPPALFSAAVPFGRTIWFARWRAAHDFADCDLGEQGWLMHELTHCWQAARGIFPAWAKLRALGVRAYRYALAPEKAFAAYNIEQQAEIVRHLFLARAGASAPDGPPGDALEAVWAGRALPRR